MGRPYLQYDVFTTDPLQGNQLAVFTQSAGLDTGAMQRIAREMNFSETTFILPAEWAGTDVRMRIFTPTSEMPMAGHPTIGSTFALAEIGVIKPGTKRFIFHLNAGPTPVDLQWKGDRLAFVWMTQPNPVFGPTVEDRGAVAAALALTPDDLLPGAPVQQVSCAVPFLFVPLRDRAAVDRAVSDAAAFRRLAASTGLQLPIFLFAIDAGSSGDAGSASPSGSSAGSASPDPAYNRRAGAASADPPDRPPANGARVYSRMFAPDFGITEDPATGIASGPLGCYLVAHGLVSAEAAASILSHQGVAMGRASRVHIAIAVEQGVIADVKVGGQAVLVARGELLA